MSVLVTWLIRTIGIGGCAFLATLIYFTGIPGASRIPYLSSVPLLGDLTTGRMHTYAADQVKLAVAGQKAQCEADKTSLVSKYELTAVQAQLDRERALRVAADQSATEAQKRADATLRAKQAAETEIDRLRQEAEANKDLSRPTEGDRKWLSEH